MWKKDKKETNPEEYSHEYVSIDGFNVTESYRKNSLGEDKKDLLLTTLKEKKGDDKSHIELESRVYYEGTDKIRHIVKEIMEVDAGNYQVTIRDESTIKNDAMLSEPFGRLQVRLGDSNITEEAGKTIEKTRYDEHSDLVLYTLKQQKEAYKSYIDLKSRVYYEDENGRNTDKIRHIVTEAAEIDSYSYQVSVADKEVIAKAALFSKPFGRLQIRLEGGELGEEARKTTRKTSYGKDFSHKTRFTELETHMWRDVYYEHEHEKDSKKKRSKKDEDSQKGNFRSDTKLNEDTFFYRSAQGEVRSSLNNTNIEGTDKIDHDNLTYAYFDKKGRKIADEINIDEVKEFEYHDNDNLKTYRIVKQDPLYESEDITEIRYDEDNNRIAHKWWSTDAGKKWKGDIKYDKDNNIILGEVTEGNKHIVTRGDFSVEETTDHKGDSVKLRFMEKCQTTSAVELIEEMVKETVDVPKDGFVSLVLNKKEQKEKEVKKITEVKFTDRIGDKIDETTIPAEEVKKRRKLPSVRAKEASIQGDDEIPSDIHQSKIRGASTKTSKLSM